MSHQTTLKFDHQLLRLWRDNVPKNVAVLLAVSGGVDSLIMADFLWRWQRLLKLELVIAHVHHGKMNGVQGRFRDRAAKTVMAFAKKRDLPLWGNFSVQKSKLIVDGPKVLLKNETDFRKFRWQWLRDWQAQWQLTYDRQVFISTAHTADDLIETQLLRLLRGTGPDGLKAMSFRDQDILRPLLQEAKSTLLSVAKKRHIKWVEDPSNRKTDVFRNWLRQHWLKPLRKRWPEAAQNMARSFSHIVESLPSPSSFKPNKGLRRQELMAMTRVEQRRILVQYFRQLGLFNYTQGHIDEILKRLDTGRRDLTFDLLGRRCVITAEWVALRLD